MSQHKKCNGPCGLEKNLEEFSPDPKGYLGRRANCKECRRQRDAELAEQRKAGVPIVRQTSQHKKPVMAQPVEKPKKSAVEEPVVVEKVVTVEKIVEVEKPLSDAEVQKRVDEQVQAALGQRKKRLIQSTLDERVRIRATRRLINKYPLDYERMVERERLALISAEHSYELLTKTGS